MLSTKEVIEYKKEIEQLSKRVETKTRLLTYLYIKALAKKNNITDIELAEALNPFIL